MDQIDLTGYTAEEIERMQRVEHQAALHEEICWMGDHLKGDDRDIAHSALNRLAWLNQQNEILAQRAANWEAVANGALASAKEFQTQRDTTLDEYSEYIKEVQAGTHRDVREMLNDAHQEAFEEFQANAGRLMALAQKLRTAG